MRNSVTKFFFLGLCCVAIGAAQAGDITEKIRESSQIGFVGTGRYTGRHTKTPDRTLQAAIRDCEFNLALAPHLVRALTGPKWSEISPDFKKHPISLREDIATRQLPKDSLSAAQGQSLADLAGEVRIPPELETADYMPARYIGTAQYIFPVKEDWVLTDFHLAHHYPGQGPTHVDPDDPWEHERQREALMKFYEITYDPETLAMVKSTEESLPRQRKKILIVRQPLEPLMSIYGLSPGIISNIIATAALFDASQDPRGPRFNEGPEDYLSPVERILKNSDRGANILQKIQTLRRQQPFVPIFEEGNYILDCPSRVDRILCSILMDGWIIHQHLKHHPNGYYIIHTMKESTTRYFEKRFEVSRNDGKHVFPVMKNDGSGQAFPGEHVFIMPIRQMILSTRNIQRKALEFVEQQYPNYRELLEKFQRYFEAEMKQAEPEEPAAPAVNTPVQIPVTISVSISIGEPRITYGP